MIDPQEQVEYLFADNICYNELWSFLIHIPNILKGIVKSKFITLTKISFLLINVTEDHFLFSYMYFKIQS